MQGCLLGRVCVWMMLSCDSAIASGVGTTLCDIGCVGILDICPCKMLTSIQINVSDDTLCFIDGFWYSGVYMPHGYDFRLMLSFWLLGCIHLGFNSCKMLTFFQINVSDGKHCFIEGFDSEGRLLGCACAMLWFSNRFWGLDYHINGVWLGLLWYLGHTGIGVFVRENFLLLYESFPIKFHSQGRGGGCIALIRETNLC